jgi:hypothetical protein
MSSLVLPEVITQTSHEDKAGMPISSRSPRMTTTTSTVSKGRSSTDSGETDRDRCALTWGAADRNASAVFFDDFFDTGKTQSNT